MFIENLIQEKIENERHQEIIINLEELITKSVGIALALVRISEPYFWKHLVQDSKFLFNKIFNRRNPVH